MKSKQNKGRNNFFHAFKLGYECREKRRMKLVEVKAKAKVKVEVKGAGSRRVVDFLFSVTGDPYPIEPLILLIGSTRTQFERRVCQERLNN